MPDIKPTYTICTRCIMRVEDDPAITFDAQGVCSYCRLYDTVLKKRLHHGEAGKQALQHIVDHIKRDGAGKEYDCIIGVSGGLDSTYTVWLAVQAGLRPLLVHCDNSWDSELAVKNIEDTLTRLHLDLYTYVINWVEFRDLQLAYLKASVVDIEAITDHAIVATLFEAADKHNLKYVLSGENYETEGVLPSHWVHTKSDAVNIRAIHNRFGMVPMKTFPLLTNRRRQYLTKVKHIQYIRLLDYVPYNKERVKQQMREELGWTDYKEKHFESIFTRFYQSYILPRKFHIDKRRVHLSVLVQSGQLTREEALQQIARPPLDEVTLRNDKTYVIKKLGITETEFEQIMQLPVKSHYTYPTMKRWRRWAGALKRTLFK